MVKEKIINISKLKNIIIESGFENIPPPPLMSLPIPSFRISTSSSLAAGISVDVPKFPTELDGNYELDDDPKGRFASTKGIDIKKRKPSTSRKKKKPKRGKHHRGQFLFALYVFV